MIINEIIIGVVSGIISSVMVTQVYRIKDKVRDRQSLFEKLCLYSSQLSDLDCNDIDSIFHFLSFNIFPKLYKWVKLTKEETDVIIEFMSNVIVFEDLVIKYIELDKNLYQKTFGAGEKEDIHDKILLEHEKIVKFHPKLMQLGNPTMQYLSKKIFNLNTYL